MMRRAWPCAVVVVSLIAGCTAGDTPVAIATESAPLPPDTPVIASWAGQTTWEPAWNTNETVAPWTSLQMSASGPAGSWLLGYQPLPSNRTSLDYGYAFTVDTEGTQPAFVWPPFPVFKHEGGFRVNGGLVFVPHGIIPGSDGGLTYSVAGGLGIGSGEAMTGFLYAVAAADAWEATMRVDLAPSARTEETVEPAFLRSGTGTVIVVGADHLTGVGPTPGVGQARLEHTTETSGWVHLQALFTWLQPTGIRQQAFQLPGGHSVDATGTSLGYDLVASGSASSGNWFDAAGVPAAPAGTATAVITYAEADLGLDIGLAFIPLGAAHVPPGLVPDLYGESKWPFGDGPGPLVSAMAA